MPNGKVIVIVAPSGSGKSTLIKKLKSDFPSLSESISCTTRDIRTGEEDGIHYHFIKEEDFKEKIDQGEFLEWAIVHSNYYGTSKVFVDEQIRNGDIVLFDIDVQGADSLQEYFKGSENIIFIEPPSLGELKDRLIKRGTDSIDVINERINNAAKEMLKKDNYDYLIVNDDLDRSYLELKNIVKKIIES